MGIAHGPAVSSSPLPHRTGRAGPKAACPQSCFVAVFRLYGEREDVTTLPKDVASVLAFLNASYVSTCESETLAKYLASGRSLASYRGRERWVDTYRIPMGAKTLAEIGRILRSKGIKQAPSWGKGKVGLSGTGAGESTRSKVSSNQREAYRKVVANGCYGELLLNLFGTSTYAVPDCFYKGDFGDSLPGSWDYSVEDWFRLRSKYSWFESLFNHCDRLWTECEGGDEETAALNRCRLLKIWIARELKMPVVASNPAVGVSHIAIVQPCTVARKAPSLTTQHMSGADKSSPLYSKRNLASETERDLTKGTADLSVPSTYKADMANLDMDILSLHRDF
jgi:hypothetical protein